MINNSRTFPSSTSSTTSSTYSSSTVASASVGCATSCSFSTSSSRAITHTSFHVPMVKRHVYKAAKKYHVSIKQETNSEIYQNISIAAHNSVYRYLIWSPQTIQGKSFAQREGKQLRFFEEQTERSDAEKHNDIEGKTLSRTKISLRKLHSSCDTSTSVRSFQMPKTSLDTRELYNEHPDLFTTYKVNHARESHSPFPIRTSDAGKIKRNKKINFRSKENMMDYFKNRSFSEDGNGFSDCVFTQSVENGCQNKEI